MDTFPPEPPDETEADGPDNLIMMPGLGRIPEPSPIRHGHPGLRELDGDGGEPQADAELEPSDSPPAMLMVPALEALLFAAEGPLTEARLDEHLGGPGLASVRGALAALRIRYGDGSGVRLVQVAKGWQLRTDPRFARWVGKMRGGRPVRLSRAALETLAVIAYRQPVTKPELDELRGVDSGGVLRMLVERGLVAAQGRRDEPGRPLMYGSTNEFLTLFGLRDLSDLPTLRDLHELQADDPRLGPLGDAPLGQQLLPLVPVGLVEDEPE